MRDSAEGLLVDVRITLQIKYKFIGGDGETQKIYALGQGILMGFNLLKFPVPKECFHLFSRSYLDTVS